MLLGQIRGAVVLSRGRDTINLKQRVLIILSSNIEVNLKSKELQGHKDYSMKGFLHKPFLTISSTQYFKKTKYDVDYAKK